MRISIIFILSIFISQLSISQELNYFQKRLVNSIDSNNLKDNLRELEKIGIREPGRASHDSSALFLESYLKNLSQFTVERDSFVFKGDTLYNIIATLEGVKYPDSFLIICAHYDSRGGPGMNDNGSGVAVLLESARALNEENPDISLRFILFTAEESGFGGSTHYARNAKQNGEKIKLVFNIDQVGGNVKKANTTIVCERDEDSGFNSPASNNLASAYYTDTISRLTEKYGPLKTRIDKAFSSDYIPFERRGFVITGFYEANPSKDLIHSPRDTFENLDINYIFKTSRAATASLIYLSGIEKEHNSIEEVEARMKNIYFNSGQIVLHENKELKEAVIYSLGGIRMGIINPGNKLENLKTGIYIYELRWKNGMKERGKIPFFKK